MSVLSVHSAAALRPDSDLLRPRPQVVNVATASKSIKTEVVVVSDVHLGSHVSRARALREALAAWYPFRRLIILGDLFENLNFSRLSRVDFEVIDDLRDLASRDDVTVDWIEGNHDEDGHELVNRLIGANTHKQMLLDFHDQRYLCIHGHQFDDFLNNHPRIGRVASAVYNSVQVREGRQRRLSRWLKHKSKKWLKVAQKVERQAVDYALRFDANFILCGHTHYYDPSMALNDHPVRYINTGCWTDTPSTLTTIDRRGLRQFIYS